MNDVASGANQYMTNGNGVGVVVWPIFNDDNATINDSAFTIVYVTMPNDINDFDPFEKQIVNIQNPLSQSIVLNYDELIYQNIELLDASGRIVRVIKNKKLEVNLLDKGLYYLNFYNKKEHKIITKKLLIE